MLFSAWPYILRLALAMYFVFNHLPPILSGFKSVASANSMFACTGEFLPPIVSFNIWHGFFIVLSAMILLWPRPVLFLSISTFVLLAETYLDFDMSRYGSSTILSMVCTMINIVLLIIYGRPKRY